MANPVSHVSARTLGPEQLGIAATLVLTGSFFDLISDTGSDLFLIQDGHGDTVQVQKLVQLVGQELGVKSLGYYPAVILLIYYPAVLSTDYIDAIYVPLVAAQRDTRLHRNRVSNRLGGQIPMPAIAMAVGFAIVAPFLLRSFSARGAPDRLSRSTPSAASP